MASGLLTPHTAARRAKSRAASVVFLHTYFKNRTLAGLLCLVSQNSALYTVHYQVIIITQRKPAASPQSGFLDILPNVSVQ